MLEDPKASYKYRYSKGIVVLACWNLRLFINFLRQEVEQYLGPKTWQRQSYEAFQTAITSNNPVSFRCIYATKGFKAREHRYIFLESENTNDRRNIDILASALRQYLSTPHNELGPNTSLAILFPIPDSPSTVGDYYRKYWDFLRCLRQADTKPWPKHIPTELDTPLWRLCFDGQPIFSAALTPAHQRRRSRYAPCFSIVFQPNFVFEILFATQLEKQAAISKVQDLLLDYDDVPISPELKNYGDTTGRESRQYFLMDENYTPPRPYVSLD